MYSNLKKISKPLSDMIIACLNAVSILVVKTNAMMKAAAEKLVRRIP